MHPVRLAALAAGAALLAALAPASAADQVVVQFSATPNSAESATQDIRVRPNAAQSFYLWAANPTKDARPLRVVFRGPGGKTLTATTDKAAPPPSGDGKLQWVPIKLPKLEAPKPAVPAAPAPAAGAAPAAPAAPAAEEPAGLELEFDEAAGAYTFEVSLFVVGDPEFDAKEVNGKPAKVLVRFRDYSTYVEPSPAVKNTPVVRTGQSLTVKDLDVTVTAKGKFPGPDCPVSLYFPPQENLDLPKMRQGSFDRNLALTGTTSNVVLGVKELPIRDNNVGGRFYVGVDGFRRAFRYDVDWKTVAESNKPALPSGVIDARLYLGDSDSERDEIASGPAKTVPIRVEVDNPPANSYLELQIDRAGGEKFQAADEHIRKKTAFDEHVFVDVDGSLKFTTKLKDWTIDVPATGLRGRHALKAVLMQRGATEPVKLAGKASTTLVFDATPPVIVTPLGLPDKYIRGQALKVSVRVTEDLSDVKRVLFVYGALGEDKKLPPNAVTAWGSLVPGGSRRDGVWEGALELPPEVKGGPGVVTVIAENEAGQKDDTSKKILLVEPGSGAATGGIKGKVTLGGRGQPNLIVGLRDGEGKEKAVAKTNEKGEFEFKDVPPGAYKVASAKPDSGVGTKGDTAAEVIAGKTTEGVEVKLTRKP